MAEFLFFTFIMALLMLSSWLWLQDLKMYWLVKREMKKLERELDEK